MRHLVLTTIALCCSAGTWVKAAEPAKDYLKAPVDIVEAWKDMRYGMFLCWGPVSLTGKEIGWSRGAPPWGRRPGVRGGKGPTPVEVYDNLHKKWKPDQFDAEQWVQVAKDGGMRYLIFLVKHHDGFCLYDTQLTDFKITGPESAWKVDVMKHVADACHKHGLKLMIYYSQPDWHHPDYLGEHHERYIKYLHGQVRELLTNYGHIDGLWFDNLRGRGNNPQAADLWDAEALFKMARSIQPHLIINDRCGLDADFYTPENKVGFFMNDRPWETNATLNGQWAWEPAANDAFFRSYEECVRMLVCCVTGDGNFALNTGPMPDGRIEPRQVERFREIGQWLKQYGVSVYDTRGGPYIAPDENTRRHEGYYSHFKLPKGRWWGGSTYKGNVVYLHILRWPDDSIFLPNIGRKVVSCTVLTGGKATVTQLDEGLSVSVPREHRNALDTIVRIEFDRWVDDISPVLTAPKSLTAGCRATASGIWPNPRLGAELAFDGNPNTRWGGAPDTKSGWLAVDLGKTKSFRRLVVAEAYDRVRKFELEVKANGQWQTIHSGTNLGNRYSATFEPVTAQHVRLNILEASDVPTIWEVELFSK